MRVLAAMLVVVGGCGASSDQPERVVRDYLQARASAHCQYLTAPEAKRCRKPGVPEPPAARIVIERVRVHGAEATIRVSYDWTGYRRHSTFALVRQEDRWLIANATPDD